MLELPRYFPAILLDLTWELESQLDVQRTHDGPHKVTVMGKTAMRFLGRECERTLHPCSHHCEFMGYI
jgi:hypothetical protein